MKYFYRKEPGSGGVVYVFCFMGVLIGIILFAFFTFHANLYLVKDALKTGLYCAESIALTVNNRFEDEDSRMHIIPSHTPGNIIIRSDGKKYYPDGTQIPSTYFNFSSELSYEEREEVENTVNAFLNAIIAEYELENKVHPTKGPVMQVCGRESRVLISKLTIYEPIYGLLVSRQTPTNPLPPTETDPFIDPEYDFILSYEPQAWIAYDIICSNNNQSYEIQKRKCTTIPTLQNGKTITGATIEATISVTLKGVKNIFAAVGSTNIFTTSPVTPTYDVSVTQAYDITLTDLDDRVVH